MLCDAPCTCASASQFSASHSDPGCLLRCIHLLCTGSVQAGTRRGSQFLLEVLDAGGRCQKFILAVRGLSGDADGMATLALLVGGLLCTTPAVLSRLRQRITAALTGHHQ